jgi:hypothetical protein
VTTATDVAALDAYRCLMHRDRAVRRALAARPIAPAAAATAAAASHLCAQCGLPLLTLAEVADGAASAGVRVCVGSDGRATHWACAEQHERRGAEVFICRGEEAAQRQRRQRQRGAAVVEGGGASASSRESRLQLLKQIDRGDGVDRVLARLHA